MDNKKDKKNLKNMKIKKSSNMTKEEKLALKKEKKKTKLEKKLSKDNKKSAKLFKSKKRKVKKPKVEKVKKEKSYLEIRDAKRKRHRLFTVCGISIGLLVVVLGGFKIAGALTINAGEACKIGDSVINESEVTQYIKDQTYYKQYSKSSSSWSQFLSMYGMTPDKFREQTIQDKFVHEKLVQMAAEKEGLSVEENQVDDAINPFKEQYSTYNDYKKGLDKSGFTEESYRDHVRQTLLEKALINKVCEKKQPSDSDLSTFINSNVSTYKDARRSSHILFNSDDKDKAQQVLDDLNAGKISWEDAVSQYSIDEKTKASAGDRGWDKIETFTQDYNSGLSGLDAGKICTTLIYDKDGVHIVKCTEKWNTPEKVENLNGIPQAIIDKCREKKIEDTQSTDLKTWLDNFKTDNNIEVTIYPMPSDVPYNVAPKSKASSTVPTTSTSTPEQ